MKNQYLLFTVISAFLCLDIQAQTVGYFETFEGEKIDLHASTNKKLSRMPQGCECELSKGNDLKYVNEEGKVAKIKQYKIKQLHLSKGNTLCLEAMRSSFGNVSNVGLSAELDMDIDYYGLPTKKKGKFVGLHSVIFEANDYMITMYSDAEMNAYCYIFRKSDNKLMADPFLYLSVGYKKKGTQALNDIKKYFKDCTEFIDSLESQLAKNENLGRFRKVPIMQSISSNQCLD